MATTVAKRVDDIPRKWYRHEELESLVQSTCKLGGQLRLLGKLEDSLLQVSYYDATEHCLALSSVSTPYRLFALALSILNPSTSVYATAPYEDAFNWSEVMHTLKALASYERYHWPQTEFYVVDFRSQLKAELDRDKLFELDRESHREATQSGGLLKYWFGTPDSERKNLATCLWRDKEDAIAGGKGPWHKLARGCTVHMYDQINVRALRLTIDKNIEGWAFEPFSTG